MADIKYKPKRKTTPKQASQDVMMIPALGIARAASRAVGPKLASRALTLAQQVVERRSSRGLSRLLRKITGRSEKGLRQKKIPSLAERKQRMGRTLERGKQRRLRSAGRSQ